MHSKTLSPKLSYLIIFQYLLVLFVCLFVLFVCLLSHYPYEFLCIATIFNLPGNLTAENRNRSFGPLLRS